MSTTEFKNNVDVTGNLDVTGTFTTGRLVVSSTTGGSVNDFSIKIGNSTTGNVLNETTSTDCILIGPRAGLLTTGNGNVVVGSASLTTNATGTFNTVVGDNALTMATSSFNTVIGRGSGAALTTGTLVAVGNRAGDFLTEGSSCVFIGNNADTTNATADNQISIGQSAVCDLENQCTIGNASMAIIRPGVDNVCDLGESDRGFKDLYLTNDATVGGDLDVTGTSTNSAYWSAATQTLTATNTVISSTWTSSISGTAGWITESSGVFTIVATGSYIINANQTYRLGANTPQRNCTFQLKTGADATLYAQSQQVGFFESSINYANSSINYLFNGVSANYTFQFKSGAFTNATDITAPMTSFTIFKV